LSPECQFVPVFYHIISRIKFMQLLDLRGIGNTMPDISDPVFSGDLYRDIFFPHDPRQFFSNDLNAVVIPTSDIKDLAFGRIRLHSHSAGIGNILHMNEIPLLLSVLKDHWRIIVKQSGCENGEYSRIRIGKSLASSINIEESQGCGWNIIGLSCDQT